MRTLFRSLLLLSTLFFCTSALGDSTSTNPILNSPAFFHADRRLESLNYEERYQWPRDARMLYLLGQYQECLLRFLYESESDEIYLQGMQELFYHSAKVDHGSFYSIDYLKLYRFTSPELESQIVDIEYNGSLYQGFYNTFKSNRQWTAEEREALYQREEDHYSRDGLVKPITLDEETIRDLKPNTIYNFVLLPDDTVSIAEERLGAREYHVAGDDTVTERFTHPNHSILAGSANQAIVTAGAFTFVQNGNKRLYFVSNKSGHYRPLLLSLGEFRHWCGRHGIEEATVILLPDLDIPRTLIENYDPLCGNNEEERQKPLFRGYSIGIPIAIDRKEATRLLNAARRQWLHVDKAIDRDLLEALADGDNRVLTEEAIEKLNAGRDQLNYMRCAYTLLLNNHRSPPLFHQLVKRFGKLKDAIKHQISHRIRSEAQRLIVVLNSYDRGAETLESEVTDEASFYISLQNKIDQMHALMSCDSLHIDDYHDLKKAARDIAVLFRLHSLEPANVERDSALTYQAAAEAFTSINTEMGKVHDDYVGDNMRGIVGDDVYIELPTDLRIRLKRYLDYVTPEPPTIDLMLTTKRRLSLASVIWSITHDHMTRDEEVYRALTQLSQGEPVDVPSNLKQWLTISKKAADVTARICQLVDLDKTSQANALLYINEIDRILEAIPTYAQQGMDIVIEDMMPLTKREFTKELVSYGDPLQPASQEEVSAAIHHIVDNIRSLTSIETISLERLRGIQDDTKTLAALVDLIKKEREDKEHRYEVYDALSRTISALIAQLDAESHHMGGSLSPETRRLAGIIANKLRRY